MGTLPSQIERVTVYRKGARIVRALALEESATEVRFTGLPLTLDDGSLRARAIHDRGERDQGPLAVDVRVGLEVPGEDATLAPAEDAALERAGVDAERARTEVVRLQAAMGRLNGLKIVPRPAPRENEPPLPIPRESRQQLVALRLSEQERIGGALAAAIAVAREAEKTLADATAASKRATTAKNARQHELRKVATVSLVGAVKGTRVLLEYAIPDARWSASYVLTLAGQAAGDASSASATLAMRALVAQRSGEDWRGVVLSLSTAEADAWVELPELAKARIGRAQPRPRKAGYREPPEGSAALYADYDRAVGPRVTRAAAAAAPPPPPPQRPAKAGLDDDEDTSRGMMVGGAAFPQPMPPTSMAFSAPPAPAPARASGSAAPRAAMSRSMPAAAPPAGVPGGGGAPMAKRARMQDLSDGAAMERSASLAEPGVAAPAWDLAAETLTYGRLRMRAPSDASRGELVAVAQASVYLEALASSVQLDVAMAIRIAVTQAAVDDGALPAGYELAATSDSYDYLYAAELPCDVESDGAFHAIPVADWDARTKLRHVATPREAPQVYRMIDIESPIDAALLSGPLDVYEVMGGPSGAGDAMYRTTTRMPETPPRGRVEIGLGVEPAIKVARTTTFQEETSGLLGGALSLGHRVSVELRNLLPRPVTVEVRERVPVARKDDTEVKVEVGAVDPAWERWDQEQSLRGGHLWRVTLEPGTTRTLSARYAVKISSKLELVGGNRRDS